MQGIAGPGGLCFHSCRMGGEFWHEVCVVVGVVVGQGLRSVFVGVFSMFSGCPPHFTGDHFQHCVISIDVNISLSFIF